MLLLHISDIHFKDPLCHSDEDPDLYFRDELVRHAGDQTRDLGDVDVILVSGDIAFCGIRSEYDAATKWLETLGTNVGCNKRRIYVIPGNHDVDQSVFETNEAAKKAISGVEKAGNNEEREHAIGKILTDDESTPYVFASIADYNLFAAKYDCQVFPDRLRWNHRLRIDSCTALNVYGLNSAIISGVHGKDQKGNLFMSALQMSFPIIPGTVNLIMSHHPPEWMSDQDQIEMRLFGTPNIVLLGHRHRQLLHREYEGSIAFSAGSVNPDRNAAGWEPAYNLIELTSESKNGQRCVKVSACQFRWQSNPNGFVPKLDMVTKKPIFDHKIPVDGVFVAADEETPSVDKGGAGMSETEKPPDETAALVGPNVRDVIYRFWELEPWDRIEVLNELGIKDVPSATVLETMAYRTALVEIAKEDRLSELGAAIAKREK